MENSCCKCQIMNLLSIFFQFTLPSSSSKQQYPIKTLLKFLQIWISSTWVDGSCRRNWLIKCTIRTSSWLGIPRIPILLQVDSAWTAAFRTSTNWFTLCIWYRETLRLRLSALQACITLIGSTPIKNTFKNHWEIIKSLTISPIN